MTPNQIAYRFFNKFYYVKYDRDYHEIGYTDVTLMIKLTDLNLMHITAVFKHPKDQFNYREAKEQLNNRMNKYLTNGDNKLGITYTFSEFVDRTAWPSLLNMYNFKKFGDFKFLNIKDVWEQLEYQNDTFTKDIVTMFDNIANLNKRKYYVTSYI